MWGWVLNAESLSIVRSGGGSCRSSSSKQAKKFEKKKKTTGGGRGVMMIIRALKSFVVLHFFIRLPRILAQESKRERRRIPKSATF
jgi:hypothetical protein